MSRRVEDIRQGWQTVKTISDLRDEQRGKGKRRPWRGGEKKDIIGSLAEGEIQAIVAVMMGR